MPSTSDLSDMPSPSVLKEAMQKNAVLEVIMSDEAWLRCHTFQQQWSKGVSLAKYDNGGGNHLFAFFCEAGCIIKGFDHESPVSPYAREEFEVWPGIYEGVPPELLKLLDDKAVEKEHVTFCIWSIGENSPWQMGEMEFPEDEDDGSSYLLDEAICTSASDYVDYAADYYEKELDLDVVQAIYSGKPVTDELIQQLNPNRKAKAVYAELQPIYGKLHDEI
ncbi:MAG: hypothetical protein KDA84_01255 [Planctomycetaceae bacterium]|nr:hypothetical protein [Planctomycetaceae bacterium]